jgi:hypothetical protein
MASETLMADAAAESKQIPDSTLRREVMGSLVQVCHSHLLASA